MNHPIWSPTARSVELCCGPARHPLVRLGRDHWQLPPSGLLLPAGTPYRVSLDGGEPVPDPFARWQPEGVHGDSQRCELPPVPDPAIIFQPRPLAEAVIYEMHLGTFTPEGTYAAARARLPHLAALGITHLELMPLATFPGRQGWGYDGVYLFAPHPAYGTPAELRAFVDACHAHGLAVLLDVVYNHLGPDGNYLARFGPCFSPRWKTLWGDALNYDEAGSDGIRQLVLDNATMWLRDYGFDGLRLDAVHALVDTRATPIMEELSAHVRRLEQQLRRPLLLIAESDLNDPRLVRPPAAGGWGLDAFWADDFHHAVHRFLTQETQGYYGDYHGLEDVVTALRSGYVYQGQYAPHRSRGHGRPPVGLKPGQLVFCLQNHDQVGNRGNGERLSMLLPELSLKAAAALLLLSPAVPLLFQGEEWGAGTPFLYFTDHQDAALGRAVSEGRRREFAGHGGAPDPQDPATWRRSQLQWQELEQPAHAGLLAWYRQLIALRPRLAGAGCRVNHDVTQNWLTLDRGPVLAVFNFSPTAQAIPLPEGDWQVAFASVEGVINPGRLPALATCILTAR